MPGPETKELRKAGKLEEALLMAKAELEAAPNDIWAKRNMSWVYFDLLKKAIEEKDLDEAINVLTDIKQLELPDSENMLFDNIAWKLASFIIHLPGTENSHFEKVNSIFFIIKDFAFPKPSDSYSFLYKALHKFFKDSPIFLEIADWWNFENFQPKDYEKYVLENGRTIMAIAEQAYIAYSKSLLNARDEFGRPYINEDKVREFLPKLVLLNERYPKYQYPPYFQAKLLLKLGDRDSAFKELLPFAKRKSSEFWIWTILADLNKSDADKHFSCYCKALSCNAQEEMVVAARENIAALFIERGLFNEARTEIELLIRARLAKKWTIPPKVIEWQNQDWFSNTTIKQSNKDVYRKFARAAETILYADIPEELIFVDFVNKDKKILNFYDNDFQKGFFKYDRFIENINVGDVLSARFEQKEVEQPSIVTTLAKTNDPLFKSKFFKEVESKIQMGANKPYGFLEDVFINPKLVNNYQLSYNQICKISARKSYNKEKGQWQWSAIDITEAGNLRVNV